MSRVGTAFVLLFVWANFLALVILKATANYLQGYQALAIQVLSVGIVITFINIALVVTATVYDALPTETKQKFNPIA